MRETSVLHIDTLDISDDSVLTDAYRIESAANQAARPGWEGIGPEARILGWRSDDGWTNHLIGAWEHSTLLGFAALMTADDVPDTSWVLTWVGPDHQRRGIGTALLQHAELGASARTTRFVSRAYGATADALTQLEERYARPLGYSVATTETVLELDLKLPALPPVPVADRYTVATYVNGVPEQFREQVGRIKGMVDAEAPNGELAWNETAVSPAAYADEMMLWIAQGSTVIESIATNERGDVTAWTCLVCSKNPDRPADIEGTLVLKNHRGRGLGRAVKSASLDAARSAGTAKRVRTSSDDQNVWMYAINTALGFVAVENEVLFQKAAAATDGLARHI